MNALVYVDIDQGIHKGKILGFSFYINIGNFEAFLQNLNLSANRLFLRCVQLCTINKEPEHLQYNYLLHKSLRNAKKND